MHTLSHVVTGRKIRMALVGCGRISKNHFGSMEQHADNVEIVDVCDIDPWLSTRPFSIQAPTGHLSMTEMLKTRLRSGRAYVRPVACIRSRQLKSRESGRHVMTEKPMATRWHDGLRMVRACDEAGVRMFVVKQNRRNTTLQLLKRAVEQKRFGQIYMVNLNVFWTRPQDYYDRPSGAAPGSSTVVPS